MDGSHLVVGIAGFAGGWLVRFFNPAPVPVPVCPPCRCERACAVTGLDHSAGIGGGTILGVLACILVVLAANAILVCKVSVTKKGGEQEFAFSVKGRSKGIVNPARAFQLTQG